MGKRGVNPKAWFYGFGRHLNRPARVQHVRRALAGSSAEQWLNMEFNAYLLDTLPPGLYAYPESSKRDLSVFSFEYPEQNENEHVAEAVIETKLIYRQYSQPSISRRIGVMAAQLKRTLDAEEACKAVGLVFGVWANWTNPARPVRTRAARRLNLASFRDIAGKTIRDAALEWKFRGAKPTMETLVAPGTVKVGPWNVEIALVGQYFLQDKD